MARIRAASDIGGTFTDLVYFDIDDNSGKVSAVRAEKSHTTPGRFEQAVLDTFDKAEVSLADVELFAHGTTVVINTLLERKGVKTGLITTRGFRDVLEIGRGDRPDFFNLRYQKPEPFVPRYLRQEVSERLTYTGEVVQNLVETDVDELVKYFQQENVEAIAVCLLHAYANPSHEQQVAQRIAKLWPEVSVVTSHQLTRQWREYERSNTAAVCAYVQPIADRYLSSMQQALNQREFDGTFYVMQSNGGVDTVEATKRTPITIIESGPASGVLGAAALGELLGIENVIAFDIGGTTAKCSLIDRGKVSITSQYMIEKTGGSAGYPIMTPVVDIVEIGNGGGSIGWVDAHSKLHVGPRSAGAEPGPVAYGRGGTEPTTTDANLMMSRINPDYFIGGQVKADMEAVTASFATLGESLGLSAADTARGVLKIANNNMMNALKLVSINRGYDPRDFTMIAFGGGGAMHATALAMELAIPKVVIPAHGAVFSAWGMLMSDLRRDYVRTKPTLLDQAAIEVVDETYSDMEQEAAAAYALEDIAPDRLRFERYADMRYLGQEHTVQIPVAGNAFDQLALDGLLDLFGEEYLSKYSYQLDNEVEIVSYYLVAYAVVDRPELTPIPSSSDLALESAKKARRDVDFDTAGIHSAQIYDREKLGAGAVFDGPAIVEEAGSTTVVFPGQSVEVDQFGNLHISILPDS